MCNCPGRSDPAAQATDEASRDGTEGAGRHAKHPAIVVVDLARGALAVRAGTDADQQARRGAAHQRRGLGDQSAQRRRRGPPAQAQRPGGRVIAATPTGSPRKTGTPSRSTGRTPTLTSIDHLHDPPKTTPTRCARRARWSWGCLGTDRSLTRRVRLSRRRVVDEDSGALPVGASARMAERRCSRSTAARMSPNSRPSRPRRQWLANRRQRRLRMSWRDDEYEYVEDSSGLEPEEARTTIPTRRRPHAVSTGGAGSTHKTAAAVSARKYAFRKRVLMVMAADPGRLGHRCVRIDPVAWWACGSATTITLLYLAYLRRQTRIEEKVRRRRMQRMARERLGVENTHDHEYDVVPSRLRRPGARGAGDRRRGPDLRAPGLRGAAAQLRLAAGPAARRRPVARFGLRAAAGSLLAIRGYGAVGSATRSHRVGQGFESP